MPSLFARQNPLDDARNTLSSWDNCMAKSYCKWPVIVGIVVGSLIIISVVTCIARCICCGAECACCCFRCCSCCCSGSRGGRSGHKRVKSEPPPTYPTPYGAPVANPYTAAYVAAPPAPPVDTRPVNQQYRSNAMPVFTPAPVPERPQYATFGKPVSEDALPAMPTWHDGRDVHVEVEDEAVPEKRGDMEMDNLNHNGSVTNGSMAGMAAVGAARRSPGGGRSPGAVRSPIQRSPTGDSYGFPPGYQNDSFAGAGPQRNNPGPYAQQDEYRRVSPGPNNLSPTYGAGEGGYAQNQSYGRRSPAAQPQAYNQHNDHDRYDQHDHYDEPDRRFGAPSSPSSNTYNHGSNNAAPPYDNTAPAPYRSNTPGYVPSDSTRYEPSIPSAYPGQQAYSPQSAYPGQQTYQAFSPQGQQYAGVTRKAVDGSYKDI